MRLFGRKRCSPGWMRQADLASLTADSDAHLRLCYRLQVVDDVGNVGYSPAVEVRVPAATRLSVASVSPLPGSTNLSTEPLAPVGRLNVRLATNHPAVRSPKAFFRVRSSAIADVGSG